MSWTSPATAVTNTVITAAFFNSNSRDNLNYLYTNMWYKIAVVTQNNSGDDITFNAIPGNFSHLKFIGLLRSTKPAITSEALSITANAIVVYKTELLSINGAGTLGSVDTAAGTTNGILPTINAATAPGTSYSNLELIITNYANTSFYKTVLGRYSLRLSTAATSDLYDAYINAIIESTAAITKVAFISQGGNNLINSIVTMYGML